VVPRSDAPFAATAVAAFTRMLRALVLDVVEDTAVESEVMLTLVELRPVERLVNPVERTATPL
jgi:hypothetical protein